MKFNRILLMLILSIFVSRGAFASGQDIKITIDGENLASDVAPVIINNRTLVPVRAIFEAIGGEVKWDQPTQTATGSKDGDIIKIQLNSKKASINGEEVILDVPAKSIKGRTLVPVRFIIESLGLDIYWDNDNRTVVISTEKIEYTDEKYFRFSNGNISWYELDGPSDVVIPNEIDGIPVTSIGIEAFNEKLITSVVIPEGVTSIGYGAFAANKITSLTLPEGVTDIDSSAFSQSPISTITIPKGIENIYKDMFDSNVRFIEQ